MSRWLAALLLALTSGLAAAQTDPTIPEIAFEGNEVSRPSVMLRELVVRVGDPVDSQALERSRQGLLDLGLYRRVRMRLEDVDGGVRVVYVVEERYYFLTLPRGDVKSDGRYARGAQPRWDNVAGLNHTLRLVAEQEDEQRQGIGKETSVFTSCDAPFIASSPYRMGINAGCSTRPEVGDAGESWRLGAEAAEDGWGSDYSYVNLDASYVRHPAGRRHRTPEPAFSRPYRHVLQRAAGRRALRTGRRQLSARLPQQFHRRQCLLRHCGIRPPDRLALDALSVIAEAGNVFAEPGDVDFHRLYGSLGAGLRLRFSRFVDFEVELGYSIPLDSGSGKIFAGRVRGREPPQAFAMLARRSRQRRGSQTWPISRHSSSRRRKT